MIDGVGELAGKAPMQIRAALKRVRRDALEALLVRLLTIEPTITPAQLGKLRNKHRRTIIRLIEEKKLPATQWTDKDFEIPLSAVRERDRETATMPLPRGDRDDEIDKLVRTLRSLVPS